MLKFGRAVVKLRIPILIIGILLLIPAVIGYENTSVNYDMLTYLPDDMETVQGQNILKDEFGKGAFSLIVTEGVSDSQVSEITDQVKDVPHVAAALSYGEMTGGKIPDQAIPSKYLDKLKSGEDSMIAVFFDESTSAESTLQAITQIRQITDDNVYVSGMSAFVVDLKNIAEQEEPKYVAVAVACSLVILLLCTDSFLAPFIFLLSIAMAILYNMGTNILLGDISYVTKALAAVLQLAVTMDYSIFLWNSFEENIRKYSDPNTAMSHSIAETLVAIFSSAMTATAGFLAMCFMSYTLGTNLGIVMAKGCLFGLLASVTILPSLILVFRKPMFKTVHKKLIPNVAKVARAVTSKKGVSIAIVVFIVLLIPAAYGFANKPIYYDMSNMVTGPDSRLTAEETPFKTADDKVKADFDISTTEMVLCDANLNHAKAKEMLDQISDVDGVVYALGYDSFVGGMVPAQAVPSDVSDALKSGDYQLILINSEYSPSTDEVNAQCDQINSIIHQYDPNAMLIGEAPTTKDLIELTSTDFQVVDAIAIVAILIIIAIAFGSAVLPFVLVLVIEFAIMINLGLTYFIYAPQAFIAPVIISTIQLGSTVNYAILMTTRYKRERSRGVEKRQAVEIAFTFSFPAVVTSGASFFAATCGVAVYSRIGLISSICMLLARGAFVSTCSVLFILPAFLMVFDKAIVKASRGFRTKDGQPIGTLSSHDVQLVQLFTEINAGEKIDLKTVASRFDREGEEMLDNDDEPGSNQSDADGAADAAPADDGAPQDAPPDTDQDNAPDSAGKVGDSNDDTSASKEVR